MKRIIKKSFVFLLVFVTALSFSLVGCKKKGNGDNSSSGGGNSGSQSSVTIIRALSLGDVRFGDILRVLRKELTTALLCGVTLAAVAFVKLMTVDNLLSGGVTLTVALVVSLTLLCTVLAAKFIGATLPLLVHKVGLDPAVAASPMITTIVDAIALLVYFAIATALLGL